MSLHDEIEAEMAAYATASTGGLDLCTYTCLVMTERSDAYEHDRRERREVDPGFRAQERQRWTRANANRAERRRTARRREQYAPGEQLLLEGPGLHPTRGRCPARTSPRPTSTAT